MAGVEAGGAVAACMLVGMCMSLAFYLEQCEPRKVAYDRAWVRMVAAVAALWLVMVSLAPAPAHASCPPWMPTDTSTTACAAVKDCLARQAVTPQPNIVGGTPDLALARQTYACAVAAQTVAIGYERARQRVMPVPMCAAVECPVCDAPPVCGVTFVEGLACFGAMSVTAVVTGAVGVARCGQ